MSSLPSWLTRLALLLALLASVYTHASVFDKFMMPTYGNTNIHVATERDFVEHGHYPLIDYSYGGGIPNLYVPLYRVAVSELVWLTGWTFDFASRIMVMLIGLLTPLGLYVLAREWFGEAAGVLAAWVSVLPAELMIYTFRPLPQALGLALLGFVVAAIVMGRPRLAALFAFLVAWTHQEAAIFLAFSAFLIAGVYGATLVWNYVNEVPVSKRQWFKVDFWAKALSPLRESPLFTAAFGAWFVCCVAYLAWHFALAGDLNFTKLAQFQNHEGNPLTWDNAIKLTGWPLMVLSVGGALLSLSLLGFSKWKTNAKNAKLSWPTSLSYVTLLAWAFLGLVFVKNDLIGVRVFEDRFLVYLQLPMIVLAALTLVVLSQFLDAFIQFIVFKMDETNA